MELDMPKKIIIDHDRCTGCCICAQVCSLVKTGTFNPAAARIRIVDREDTGVTVPVVCQHCAEPVCLPSCPEDAIRRIAETGVVSIDPDLCVSCTVCRQVCPYGGPVYSSPEKQVVLCDHCGGDPACVSACPTDALSYEECAADAVKRLAGLGEIRKTLVRKERRR
jgi:Fe-S-cluster-containing dehydrogenase component